MTIQNVERLFSGDEIRDLLAKRYGLQLDRRCFYRLLERLNGVGRVKLPGLRTRYSVSAILGVVERELTRANPNRRP